MFPGTLFLLLFIFILQQEQCEVYQLACQSLCSGLPLQPDFVKKKRHEGPGILTYKQEGLGGGEISNPDAYDDEDIENSGVEKNEQAGVAHLVHAWIQQNQKTKVLLIFQYPLSYHLLFYRDSLCPVISPIQEPPFI